MQRTAMGLRGIMRRPLEIDWTKRQGKPHPLIPKKINNTSHQRLVTDPHHLQYPLASLEYVYALPPQGFNGRVNSHKIVKAFPKYVSLAAYLHSFRITVEGITFSFIVKQNNFYGLDIGVRAQKSDLERNLSPWQIPWPERPLNPLNGQNIFHGPDKKSPIGNLFSNAEYEGLGWIHVMAEKGTPLLYITEVQEDIHFVDEIRRQRPLSSDHKKTIKTLRLWKHLLIGALEDLASKLGFRTILGVSIVEKIARSSLQGANGSRHARFIHLYDGLFSKRRDYSNNHLYTKMYAGEVPDNFDPWTERYWVYTRLIT
jgi:hypothetical protein